MRILYYGPFRDGSGYSVAARGYLKAFDRLISQGEDIDLKLFTLDLEQRNSQLSSENEALIQKYEFKFDKRTGETSEKVVDAWLSNPEPYMFIWHQPAPMITWERYYEDVYWTSLKKLLTNAKWNVSFTVWEADKLHPSWVDTYKIYNVDGIVVPSKFNHQTFREALPNNIKSFYIPHPVEKKNLGPSKPLKLPISLEDKFVILSISQWGVRKGFDKLLMAYYLEFGHQQDVALVIKTNGSIMNNESEYFTEFQSTGLTKQKQLILEDAKQYKSMIHMDSFMEQPTCDVVFLMDFLPKENIQWLYEQADIFALPARAEGFGLTLAEAILNKLPLVTTRTSGHAEFIHPSHPYLIDGLMEPYLTKPEFTQFCNWFEPSVNSIRKKLRLAYQNHSNHSERIAGEQLEYFQERDYSLERVASDLKQMLAEISKEDNDV